MMNKQNTNSNIKIIQTRKYKDINLYLRFSIENKPLLKEKLSLLCKLVGDVSNKYPTKSEMIKIKDMLYGISCIPSYKARGNIFTFNLHYSFINPKFVDCSINEYNDFIKETLFNSIIDEKTLDEAKRTIKAATLRKNEQPTTIAKNRFIEIISKDNPCFDIYSADKKFIKNLEAIDLDELKQTYKYIINRAQLEICLCGDLNQEDINILTRYNFLKRETVTLKLPKIKCIEKKTIIDKKEIPQSCLFMVYATPFNKVHKDYFSWFVGNALLGVVPTSLLFTELREKMSLCYSIVSIDYKNEGIVRIATSIDGKSKDETIKAIEQQIQRLVKGDYDQSILDTAKTLMCNSLLSTYDDLDALVEYYFETKLAKFNYSLEEYCEKINSVSKKDISNVYKKYQHYFNYILLGTKDA